MLSQDSVQPVRHSIATPAGFVEATSRHVHAVAQKKTAKLQVQGTHAL